MKPSATDDRAAAGGAWEQSAGVVFRLLFLAVALFAAGWAVSNVRQVQPDSRAVVLRFGGIDRQRGPGLLIAWPKPIEQVVILPSSVRPIEFRLPRLEPVGGAGRSSAPDVAGDGSPAGNAGTVPALRIFEISSDPRLNTGFLLTGDLSVVHLQATLYYEITEPTEYVLSIEHLDAGLQRLFIASAVAVCAATDVDTILVARSGPDAVDERLVAARERFRADLLGAVNRRLRDLSSQGAGFGITVSRIDLAPAIPRAAKAAFDNVLIAAQVAEQQIAQARTQAVLKAQEAAAARTRTLTQAAAKATEQVTVARTRTSSVAALTRGASGIDLQTSVLRTYYERMGAIVRKAGSVTTVDAGGSHLITAGPESR